MLIINLMLKILKILQRPHKLYILYIILLIIITTFFELFIFSLLPLILNFFTDTKDSGSIIKDIIYYFYNGPTAIFVVFVIAFILRSLLSVVLSFKKYHLAKILNQYLSKEIFKKYLYQRYNFFLMHNSGSFLSKITTEVDKFCSNLIAPLMNLVTETFLAGIILIFLMVNYFYETILFTVLLVTFLSFFYLTVRKKLKFYGDQKYFYEAEKIKEMQKSFYVIQNIKIDHLEKFFIKKFTDANNITNKTNYYLGIIMELSKPLIELFLIGIVFAIIFVFYFYLNLEKGQILSMVALFVIGMFRLLPSCNKILVSYNELKFNSYLVGSIYETLNLKSYQDDDLTEKEIIFNNSIKLKNISYNYPDGTKVLKDFNIEILKNQKVGIFGKSGEGKSTFLNILCNLLEPSVGSIEIDNNILKFPNKSFQKKIGYVPQKVYLTDESILSNIIFGQDLENFDNELFKKVIGQTNLTQVIKNLPDKENTIIGERGVKLSGGQQQRLGIARALYKNPEILIFDEATNSLDTDTEDEIINTIYGLDKKITIIFVSHNESLINKCDRVYEIENGKSKLIK